MKRRTVLGGLTGTGLLGWAPPWLEGAAAAGGEAGVDELDRALGLVSASLGRVMAPLGEKAADGKFAMLDLPKVMRDELGLRVIDLNTMNFATYEAAGLEKFRAAAADADGVITNLKMNQRVDLASADAGERAEAMRQYREAIDAAALLGCRWVRPLPVSEKPDEGRLLAAMDELIDDAGEKGITVLIENFGWMMGEADSVVALMDAIGRDRVHASVDTGNWTTNEVRYVGLEKTFPLAVTCDFKAKTMGAGGEHPVYDLKRCFEIGWAAGFRGPWCFEHGGAEKKRLFRELVMLREMMVEWMAMADRG